MRWFFDSNRYNDGDSDIIGLTYKVNGIKIKTNIHQTELKKKSQEKVHKQKKMRFLQ